MGVERKKEKEKGLKDRHRKLKEKKVMKVWQRDGKGKENMNWDRTRMAIIGIFRLHRIKQRI